MIEFADRFWLLLLPPALALVLLLFHIDRKGRRASIRRFASDRLVGELVRSYSPLRKRFKNTLLLLAAGLLFLALARPQWGHTWTESRSRGIDVIFALDSSRSMLAGDIKPNRLIRAKLAIEDFVNQLEGDRIGLVAFAGSAFLQCPLTLDYGAFFQSLEAVDTNVISAGGTDLAAALQEAEAAFSSENNFKIVILITDGEDLEESGIKQAGEAAGRGVTVYAVGVGTPEGSPIPLRTRTGGIEYVRDEEGNVVRSRLDSETLERIASETGGFFVELGPTGYGLEQVLEAGLGSIPKEEISSQLQRTAIERFQWPLAAAVFLLLVEPLVGTRRGWRLRLPGRRAAALTAMLGLFALFPRPGDAQTEPPPEPGAATAENEPAPPESAEEPAAPDAPESAFARAVRERPADPVARFNRGTELYETGDYPAAADHFTAAIRLSADFPFQADAFYNLGNTRFREGLDAFEGSPPETVTEQAATVMGENDPPMRNGERILEAARTQPPPQESIRSAIGALEQRETATGEAMDSLDTALAIENATRDLWRRSINDFESALELTPDHDDARHNLDFVKERTAALASQITTQKELKKGQEQQLERIRTLIEELRKLLEEQENQDQQQNQQQQDQQQQDQQQQDQQDQQQKQSDQQQQQDPSGGEGEERSGDDQSGKPEESGDQPESEPGDREEEPQENEGSEGQPEDSGSGEEQRPESDEREPGDEDGARPEDSPAEAEEDRPADEAGAGEEESGEETEPAGSAGPETSSAEKEASEPMTLTEEQAEEAAAQRAAAAGEEGGEPGEGEEVVIGVMSTEDAARLLDSLKRSEKKLPFAGSGSEGSRDPADRRNW